MQLIIFNASSTYNSFVLNQEGYHSYPKRDDVHIDHNE